jgi:chemotaxis protein methyltransferase CheR
LDDALIRRCFHETRNLWTLDQRFRAPVTFEFHNLARGVYPSVPTGIWGMDLILCRNVLIYLDADTIRRVAQQLSETLAEDGWLITGPSDPLLEGVATLSPIVTGHGIVYRRNARRIGAPLPPTLDDVIVSSTGTPSDVAAIAAASVAPRQDTKAIPPGIVAREPGKDSNSRLLVPDARAAFAAGEYGRVLDLTRRVGDEASAALRIRAFANRDGSEAAREELDRFVERFPFSTELHLLRATLHMDLADHHEAIQSLRHVLYLDRSLIIAHFMLATAFRRQGRLDEARRAYRNARDLAVAREPNALLPLADGERAGAISEAANAELALLDARPAEAS